MAPDVHVSAASLCWKGHFESAVESFASYVHPDVLLKSTWSLAKTLKVDEETLAHWGVLNQGNGRVFQYSQFLVPGTPDLAVSSREIGQPFMRRRSHGAVADQWRAAKAFGSPRALVFALRGNCTFLTDVSSIIFLTPDLFSIQGHSPVTPR